MHGVVHGSVLCGEHDLRFDVSTSMCFGGFVWLLLRLGATCVLILVFLESTSSVVFVVGCSVPHTVSGNRN